jgi:hypothetical protein
MEQVELLNRTDTKYLLTEEDLYSFLDEIKDNYKCLDINNIRSARYATLYFDTPENLFYFQHHREKPSRLKIRKRQYVDSSLSFLEVKAKYKERTDKQRVTVSGLSENISEDEKEFIRTYFASPEALEPRINNSFERITLVSKEMPERLTIDRNIRFAFNGNEHLLKNLVVAEVKQEALSRNSTFVQALKREHIRAMGFSKYCMGMALIYQELKHNNFKEKFLHIKKITNEPVGNY